MAKIAKIKKNGNTVYPATIPDAVIESTNGFSIGEMMKSFDYDISLDEAMGNRVSNFYKEKVTPYGGTLLNTINPINKIVDGKFNYGCTEDYTISGHENRVGIWVGGENFSNQNKTYVLVYEGSVVGQNIGSIEVRTTSGVKMTLATQLELRDNVLHQFKKMIEIPIIAGSPSTSGISWINTVRKNDSINTVTFLYSFSTFSVLEKVDGYNIDDYIKASKRSIKVIPKYLPDSSASIDYVSDSVEELNKQINTLSGRITNKSVKKPNDLKTSCDIEMILTYGQSLAIGGGASDLTSDFKNTLSFAGGSRVINTEFDTQLQKDAFLGNGFVDFGTFSGEAFPPATVSVLTMLKLISDENSVDVNNFGWQLIPLTGGVSGGSITVMNKGTDAYSDILEVITKAKEFSNKLGKKFQVSVINWVQGEADRVETIEFYYPKLKQIFFDFNTDIKLITGQTNDVNFITYQTCPWIPIGHTDIAAAESQVRLANEEPNVYLCGAMYQFAYDDLFHPSDRAVIGLQQGVAAKRIINDGENWVTFQPVSHTVITDGVKYYTHLKFDVPVKPMRFDVSGDAWHNPNGKQPNFGFRLLNNSSAEMQTAEPFIVQGDTVVLTTDVNPVGLQLSYAIDGHYGGGNLCDSQNITILNKGINYVIDNFCIAFRNYVI